MNIDEKASWLANDFNEGMGLGLGDIGVLSMASILRVHFLQVKKAAEHSVHLTALRRGLIVSILFNVILLAVVLAITGGR